MSGCASCGGPARRAERPWRVFTRAVRLRGAARGAGALPARTARACGSRPGAGRRASRGRSVGCSRPVWAVRGPRTLIGVAGNGVAVAGCAGRSASRGFGGSAADPAACPCPRRSRGRCRVDRRGCRCAVRDRACVLYRLCRAVPSAPGRSSGRGDRGSRGPCRMMNRVRAWASFPCREPLRFVRTIGPAPAPDETENRRGPEPPCAPDARASHAAGDGLESGRSAARRAQAVRSASCPQNPRAARAASRRGTVPGAGPRTMADRRGAASCVATDRRCGASRRARPSGARSSGRT